MKNAYGKAGKRERVRKEHISRWQNQQILENDNHDVIMIIITALEDKDNE